MTPIYETFFHGKRITLMGLGLLGRGVGDAAFLARHGARLMVTDLKTEEQLKDSLTLLSAYDNIEYTLGEHKLEDFSQKDLIIKAAGVPLDSVYVREAKKNNIPVDMSSSLFVKLSGVPSIGVTGTRGKSTVTHLVYDMLKREGRHVLLGGNVRGVSTLALLEEVTPQSVAVLELDSWQLQGFGETNMLLSEIQRPTGPISPNISVFTTLFPDHINYYGQNSEQYVHDKAQIFLHQAESDTLVLGRQAYEVVHAKYKNKIRSRVVVTDETSVPKSWKIRLMGEHNRYNAGLAVQAARAFGVDDDVIKETLEQFEALPGRLSKVRDYNGIHIYNDTNATTPEATLASLRALKKHGYKSVLIMGGADKSLNMDALVEEINTLTKAVIFLPGTGTDAFLRDYGDTLSNSTTVLSLKEAIDEALSRAQAGDAIVLSPAFASFGLFKNEYDRGDQFETLIQKL
jgi:UDP-N-acetylmuramoylalanine--D-glutamate ligase